MIGMTNRTVNVSRLELLKKLKENLDIHRTDFEEAVVGYQVKLVNDLRSKLSEVSDSDPHDLEHIKEVDFEFPENHEQDYVEIIEMLEMSVDQTIQLDTQSFKAYVKNEWVWSNRFTSIANTYKSFSGGSLANIGGALK
jgi:hypothetical protein